MSCVLFRYKSVCLIFFVPTKHFLHIFLTQVFPLQAGSVPFFFFFFTSLETFSLLYIQNLVYSHYVNITVTNYF